MPQLAQPFRPARFQGTTSMLVMLMLALAPMCSSLCQAQGCQGPGSATMGSACHHPTELTSDDSFLVSAPAAACELPDQLLALPSDPQVQGQRISSASLFNHSALPGIDTNSGSAIRDARSAGREHHRSGRDSFAREIAFDSSVILRI
jgi:hypothetical protein